MREILPEDVGIKRFEFIKNPLPVPKRREHKEMDFALELTPENDEFDINDMTGKDFYDIE